MNAMRTPCGWFFVWIALSACHTQTSKHGLGLPAFSDRSDTPVWPVQFTRVYAPAVLPDGANAFIELQNFGTSPIDLTATSAYLANAFGSADLPAIVWEPNQRIQIAGTEATSLNLHANAGEIALFDNSLHIQAYSAWGSDPNQWATSFASLAESRGLLTTWHSALPYPLDASVAVALHADATELCANAQSQAKISDANFWQPCPASAQRLVLTRIQPNPLSTEGLFVEVYNPSGQTVDLFGVQLCIDTSCHPIITMPTHDNTTPHLIPPAQTSLADGSEDAARVLVHINPTWYQAANNAITLDFLGLPSFAGREWALAAPGAALTQKNSILWSYARFESDDSPRMLPQLTFDAASSWQTAPLPAPRFANESLAQSLPTATDVEGPAQWAPNSSVPGTAMNNARAPWRTCAAPEQAAPTDAVRILKITQHQNIQRVILDNTGSQAQNLAGYTLDLGDKSVTLSAQGALDPGDEFWIELSATQTCSGTQDLCWPNIQNGLQYGQAALKNNLGQLTDFIQWPNTQTPTQSLAQTAVAAGLWPQTTCLIDNFIVSDTLEDIGIERMPGMPGNSPADYLVTQGL